MRLGAVFNTHPPLDERIRRIDPGFQADAYRQHRRAAAAQPMASAAQPPLGALQDGRRPADVVAHWGRSASESANLVGVLSPAKMDHAARMLAALPARLREALREPQGAAAAMVALLLAPKEEVMQLHRGTSGAWARRPRGAGTHRAAYASGLDLACGAGGDLALRR